MGDRLEAEVSQSSGYESDAWLWRRWRQGRRIDNVHHALQNRDDNGLVNIQPLLICTARRRFRTLAAMIAPCSVKTYGRLRRPPWPKLEVPIWYLKFFHSS
jgi:hypothetical protein